MASTGRWIQGRTTRWQRATQAGGQDGQHDPDPTSRRTAPGTAIFVRGLAKAYAGRPAVADLELEVERSEVFALLGPNGAGKTTTTEILEGHRTRDAGEVRVLGADPGRPPAGWRTRIGIVAPVGERPRGADGCRGAAPLRRLLP